VNLGGDGLNPAEPDLEKFPEYTGAHPFEVVLHPGEVLFIPANWYHYVVSLDPSISLTFNFINAANFGAHFMSTVTDLPAWSRKLDKARLRTALGFQWQCKGWDQPA
jgi:ribosomal protein L16 Arg81 hydroxylase